MVGKVKLNCEHISKSVRCEPDSFNLPPRIGEQIVVVSYEPKDQGLFRSYLDVLIDGQSV